MPIYCGAWEAKMDAALKLEVVDSLGEARLAL
jgi:hypothetical protein